MTNLRERRQRDAFNRALEANDRPLIEPSEDEKRNGWTATSLTQYVIEQDAAASLRLDPAMRQTRPRRCNSRYNPFRRPR